ncbi:amidase domain-containing protein [Alkalihalophilus lindianensis]|uniref:Amidase domain-containing protein n=1 Tax=Alkalihalophilus lindianensis TaxID=1630542 RepID=A0ABU3XE72_9BACI|nr:amidase domain-containing protein [Alkalihalophilus lindianensis]MDV2686187.1 amidase domain-containing protein [Alkalihalophilus lindianensis]
MEKRLVQPIHELIERKNERYVQLAHYNEERDQDQTSIIESDEDYVSWVRGHDSLKKRGGEIIRSKASGTILRKQLIGDKEIVDYVVKYEQFIKIKKKIHSTEMVEERRAIFEEGVLKEDKERKVKRQTKEEKVESSPLTFLDTRELAGHRSKYNRLEAVKYAERWWNDYNPAYKKFKDNCTNYISQCLRAGGAPMTGGGNRASGWWLQKNNWSYSWSVAHSFRWYLSGAKTGLKGVERERARDLVVGDVICYDFNGDGRWQHTTIVVAKDGNGEPLVNAQTTNSRMRYWAYEDSTAWTPNIKYKFFHIVV